MAYDKNGPWPVARSGAWRKCVTEQFLNGKGVREDAFFVSGIQPNHCAFFFNKLKESKKYEMFVEAWSCLGTTTATNDNGDLIHPIRYEKIAVIIIRSLIITDVLDGFYFVPDKVF